MKIDKSLLLSMSEQAEQLLKRKEQLFPPDFCQWNEIAGTKAEDGPFQPTGIAMLDRIATHFGGRILFGGNEACNAIERSAVDPETKRVKHDNALHFIRLPNASQFTSPASYAATLGHELIHWVETRTRIFVEGVSPLEQVFIRAGAMYPPEAYSTEEIAAELGAGLLLHECGADPEPDLRSRYAAQYLHFVPPDRREAARKQACKHALEDVRYLMQFAQ